VRLEWGDVLAFEGPMWRYPDFLMRAERAYAILASVEWSKFAGADPACSSEGSSG
jgi:hypothetical protein